MTNYYINEAILSFSGNISQDSTLNMIRLSDPDAALIISRGKMQDGDELASQVEQQMKKLEKQVKELRYTPAQVVRLGIDGKMEGLEIQSQFIRGNEHVYQYQAVFVLQSSRVMMALTYARSTALTEADRVRWADIKKNLRFRLDPENTASGEAPYGVTGTCTTRRAGGWRSTNWTRKESRITGRRFWDGMRLAQECRLGRSISLYIYSDQGSHEPLARVDRAAPGEADEVLYYHTDVNGAPEEMTDGGGNIVWEAGYQVWGNLTHEKETRPVQQNLRFQGQYLDRETGLHYNLYRFYDPDIGKFISGDPISIRGGINLYQYAPNPIKWIDPLGLYNGEGQRELGKYHVFHEHNLDITEYGLSDAEHFSRGNQAISERMKNDPAFRREMQTKYPGVVEHVQPSSGGKFSTESPPGLTWHHENKPGVLSLVDRLDHKTYHKIYHPDGSGGRKKWGGGTGCR